MTSQIASLDSDSPKEECGVLGVSTSGGDSARLAFFGLYALQHRGQEAAGIAVADGRAIRVHKDQGLVSQVFESGTLDPLVGDMAIGHTRYSTTGSNSERNVQPYVVETMHGPLAVAHNGNLVNADMLRVKLLERGAGLQSSSDSEVLALMLAAAEGPTWEDRLATVMPRWAGAFSLVILCGTKIIAARDPWGFRPLSLGRLSTGGHAVASETGALRTLGCESIREIKPGEIVVLQGPVARSHQAMSPAIDGARCTFEHIYFSRPDANWDGMNVHKARQRLGEELAREHPVDADVVIPVPDSSMPAAIGYAAVSGSVYNEGFVKNRYIGRTFIEPTDELRRQGVALKFNTLPENIDGRRVIMIDDSIVRGTTSGPLVRLLREAGATEVHVRITCPPIAHPCFFGVDMGTYEELIAHHLSVAETADHIGADSLGYLSVERMMKALGRDDGYCNACFTGSYPIPVQLQLGDNKQRFDGVLQ
ncbi:MAG: amidophosphoribosyltransferase [Actinomycetia bacterium]|nr:amidophosphoribosyltransferase [Actinomycetes bacterium]MCP4959535.1 amidophosphoribosyltransferase [Actinomycetes bacterium]